MGYQVYAWDHRIMLLIYLALFVSNPQKDKAKIIVEAQNNEEYWVTLHLYTTPIGVMPLVIKMEVSIQRERGKGMHHISKSIYLRQIKLTNLF